MADDDAHAERILRHMNRDHQRDMSLYLRRFALLPPTHEDVFSLAQLKMTSITTASMTIVAASGTVYPIPFDPPLASLSETRPRLVAMDADCRKALGLPPADAGKHGDTATTTAAAPVVVVTEYAPPVGIDIFIMAAISVYIVAVALLPWMHEGTALGGFLESVWGFAGGLKGFRWLVEVLRLPVLGIHAAEAVYFNRTRMSKYGIKTWSALWWKWELSVLLEGGCAFKRIDRLARRAARKQAKTL